MPSYSTSLKLELMDKGSNSNSWGTVTNTNLGTALEQAIVGRADISMSSTTITLSLTNSNAAQDARAIYLNLTGSPGGAAELRVPAVQKPYIVKNGSDQQVTVKVAGLTGVVVPVGKTVLVYNNGTDVVTAVDYIPSLTLGAALPVASGGTGVTSLTANNVLLGNGTSAVQVVAPGTAGNVLTSLGGTWVSSAPALLGLTQPVLPRRTSFGYLANTTATISNGADCTFIGYGAGKDAVTTDYCTFVGALAGYVVTTGDLNTAVGSSAYTNGNGTGNTAIGSTSLADLTTGSSNTAVGDDSGRVVTTGSQNVFIGRTTKGTATNSLGQIVIGYNLTAKGDNTAYIGGTSGAYNAKNTTTWDTTSDARVKKAIVDNLDGLNKIEAIRVRNFEYRTADEITELAPSAAINKTGTQLGVIAQEMLPECVSTTSEGVLSVNTDPLVWYLVNAVKELSAQIKVLQDQLK